MSQVRRAPVVAGARRRRVDDGLMGLPAMHAGHFEAAFDCAINTKRSITVIPKASMIAIKKNDNFTIRNRRAQGTGDILPAGGAGVTAQCPHAPVTMHYNTCGRCRDALPGHYLCCSSQDKCNARPSAQDGGVINPVGPEAHPCAGAPPPSTEPC